MKQDSDKIPGKERPQDMRNKFDEQLSLLNDMLVEMGAMIEKAITQAIQAIVNHDKKKAKKAIAADRDIDSIEKEIETLCLRLLLRQQPVARDLRLISAALKMITDMERIGDQAADISEIAKFLIGKKYIINLEHIPQMAEATAKMVTDSIDAFVKRDLELAQKVIDYDDVVDDLFDKVKTDVIELIQKDKTNGEQAIDFIMIAKYFERIGDHASNIAEWVVFSITGRHIGEEVVV
jgi:phosphate transport system protein